MCKNLTEEEKKEFNDKISLLMSNTQKKFKLPKVDKGLFGALSASISQSLLSHIDFATCVNKQLKKRNIQNRPNVEYILNYKMKMLNANDGIVMQWNNGALAFYEEQKEIKPEQAEVVKEVVNEEIQIQQQMELDDKNYNRTVGITEDIYKMLKALSKLEGRQQKEIVVDAIKEYVNKLEKKYSFVEVMNVLNSVNL